MALTSEDELKDLKEKNNELAQKVQYWKMTAGQRENEKLELMKENNELRLKLSRLRNNGSIEARKLDDALQSASEKAISHLVKASAEIAKSMELAKAYMQDMQDFDAQLPRWSTLGGTPVERKEKVHRVPPMMGGQSIQPVVALRRTMLNTGSPRSAARSSIQDRSITQRAVPMHMLQDVYIPLTRIDMADLPNNNMDIDSDTHNADDSAADLGLNNSVERSDESGNISDEEFEEQGLQAVSEEDSDDMPGTPSPRRRVDNPLEGPSWLLDSPPAPKVSNTSVKLEPDSTTELGDGVNRTPNTPCVMTANLEGGSSRGSRASAFSPTVRRRRSARAAEPHHSPRPNSARRNSNSGRVLKVMVAKMCLEETPPQKRAREHLLSFDAPSPNGATDSAGIVSVNPSYQPTVKVVRADVTKDRRKSMERREESEDDEPLSHVNISRQVEHRARLNSQDSQQASRITNNESRDSAQRSRLDSHDSRDSDSGSGDTVSEGRVRRARKNVVYKERPLNRKLRR